MPQLSPRQLVVLVLLTLIWGLNWPVMKLGVADIAPLTFRMLSFWLGLPFLALVLLQRGESFVIPRAWWPRVVLLTVVNMVVWHALMILAIPLLSSGRAAILGYTMPIFSAVIGSAIFGDRLAGRGWVGVLAAAIGVLLLLWNEMAALGSSALGVVLMLTSAACWALGTQLLRRLHVPVSLLTLSFWMVALTCIVLTALALAFEHSRWHMPGLPAAAAVLYNGVLALAFAQVAWFFLARTLPPVASTLSVMLIPVIGVFSGALWLGEVLRWQDWTAVALMMLAIASVLWPAPGKKQPNKD
ncbi:EamA family transporter [Melaminivora suipulveris]|uniref:EamA family transporter n=1 Tax=Melaminivora suipulveris TaxID=2109913 RepID=A0A2R3QCK2_9BURK|nr:DMT family transporter [Melaminivora suipulveris]AVO49496.1 EamA family transporter [Melaminivora suipulveris]